MTKKSKLGNVYCCWKVMNNEIKPPEFLNSGNEFYIINGDVMVDRSIFKDKEPLQVGSIAFDDGFLRGIVLGHDEDYVRIGVDYGDTSPPKPTENDVIVELKTVDEFVRYHLKKSLRTKLHGDMRLLTEIENRIRRTKEVETCQTRSGSKRLIWLRTVLSSISSGKSTAFRRMVSILGRFLRRGTNSSS